MPAAAKAMVPAVPFKNFRLERDISFILLPPVFVLQFSRLLVLSGQ
jgi:hypothetical protein